MAGKAQWWAWLAAVQVEVRGCRSQMARPESLPTCCVSTWQLKKGPGQKEGKAE